MCAGRAEGEASTRVFTPSCARRSRPEQMVSVFPGRFVTEPQKAPALTRSQTAKAVTGKSRGKEGSTGASRRGGGPCVEGSREGGKSQRLVTMDNQG